MAKCFMEILSITKQTRLMKINKKTKIKGCACYGVNSIHPCFCSPFSNKDVKKVKKNKNTIFVLN